MNQYLVLALDGLIYLASYCLLVGLTAICARLFYRGHMRATWLTAAFCVFVVALGKNLLDSRAGVWLPRLDPYEQMAAGAAATLVLAGAMVYWRYAISFLSAAATALVLVLAMYGASFAVPWVSERALPPGMRMAQYLDSAYTRTREAREAAVKFKAVNDGASHLVATALHSLADLSSKEEFEALKKQFRGGVQFYAERKAAWDAMTPEERAENRKALADFMAEQGLAADRYSLSALKNASPDDVQNLVAFMKEMQAAAPAADTAAQKIRPPEESLQIFLRNIRGAEFTREDHEAMATFSKLFFEKGIDDAIAQTRTELVTAKLNPEWAGSFLAAMLETKTGLPVAQLINEPAMQEPAAASAPAATAAPSVPVIRMVSLPTKFGYLRVPRGTKDLDEMSAAADTMPVTGFLAGGSRVRVALGGKSLGLGDVYRVSRGAKTYAFRVEEVSNGLLHISSVASE